jgi:hypothetical protein
MVRFSVKLDGGYPELEARLTVAWEVLLEAASRIFLTVRAKTSGVNGFCRNPLVPCS